jgi:hypothetical protein
MGQTLEAIAQELKANDKKVQLIYAFNGTGKTRLSNEFKELIAPKKDFDEDVDEKRKFLYYSAFTEDLFYWDNEKEEPKLNIQPNSFTDWIIRDRGQDQNVIGNFQRYTDEKLLPSFIEKSIVVSLDGKKINKKTYPEVVFTFNKGDEVFGKTDLPNIKISKSEESSFVWSVFFSLLKEVVSILKDTKGEREEDTFDDLEYVFIDDPVSSLDDNHLIELAVDIAHLIKTNESDLKFIITTHNPLFYNVISNELNNKYGKNPVTEKWLYKENDSLKHRLNKKADGTFLLTKIDRQTPFSYHLQLLSEINEALKEDQIKKYHFSFIRNILEKSATFLGHSKWEKLLPKNGKDSDPFANRILNLSSHSAHAGEEVSELQDNDKEKLKELVSFLETEYKFSIPD